MKLEMQKLLDGLMLGLGAGFGYWIAQLLLAKFAG